MTIFETISLIFNLLFVSGGLVTLVTVKATRNKAEAEARKVLEEATGAQLENDQKAMDILMAYIVEPLKKELNALRKEVRALNRAIAKISNCPHADDCPVLHELRNHDDRENK